MGRIFRIFFNILNILPILYILFVFTAIMTYTKEEPESIERMFGSIARDYDRGNAILSFFLHRLWNQKLVKSVLQTCKDTTLLDLCCGTGDIAFAYLQQARQKRKPVEKVYLLDFCQEMLNVAKEKANKKKIADHTLSYFCGDAQAIPLPQNSVGCATIAYGIRNVQKPEKCFGEVMRVLKPGGTFAILELTRPQNRFLAFGHAMYLRGLIPLMGRLITSNQEAYQYLCKSIQTFSSPQEIASLLQKKGFENIITTPLLGGTATLISSKKGQASGKN